MPDAPSQPSVMEQIVSLCKRRGFVYPASEIYGGLNGFWDYGSLGVLLKNNVRDWWWQQTVLSPPIGPDGHPIEIVGLDSSIIQNPKTWVASGHVGGFSDPMVDDRETKQRYRADHLVCAHSLHRVIAACQQQAGCDHGNYSFSGCGHVLSLIGGCDNTRPWPLV